MKRQPKLKDQRGVIFILVVIALIVLIAFAALALDVGNVLVTKNELQNISDAAALAATRKLGSIYEGMSYEAQQSYNASADAATIIAVAQQVGASNRAADTMSVTINAADVEIGQWNSLSNPLAFTPTLNQPDAVRVRARKDGAANGPVISWLARVFGINTFDVSASAIAALTGQSTAGPGGIPVPIAISRAWFEGGAAFHFCNQPIRFYPTNDPASCAGWNVYNRYNNANDADLRRTIQDLQNGTYQSPETIAYVTQYEFTGGTMSTQTFSAFESLFLANRNKDLNNDGSLDAWETSVAVYDSSDCSNPNGRITIVGFATIVITSVLGPPAKTIDGYVICNNVEPARGGGGNYGTKGSIPGLVK